MKDNLQKVNLGRQIESARRRAALSQQRLAELLGIHQAAISQYEQGKITPRLERLRQIAELTKKPVEWFFQLEAELGSSLSSLGEVTALEGQDYAFLPILGGIPGGEPLPPVSQAKEYYKIPAFMKGQADYILRVKGNSLLPWVLEDDLILIKQQKSFQNGNIVVAVIEGEVTLKKAYLTAQGIELRDGEGRVVYKGKNVEIQGRALRRLGDL